MFYTFNNEPPMKTFYTLLLLCCSLTVAIAQTEIPELYAITENRGQITGPDDDVLAEAFVPGIKMHFTKKGVSYFLLSQEGDVERDEMGRIKPESRKLHYTRVDVALEGATLSKQQLQFNGQLTWKANYYTHGNEALEVSNYSTVTIKNVYQGIDWVWKINERNQLEYDFIIHPGASPAAIRMRYNGADLENKLSHLAIRAHEKLLVEGELKAHTGSDKVAVQYNVDGESRQVTFDVGAYDPLQDLVIDPPVALQWSNLYGGTFADGFRGVAAGDTNFIYLTGYSTSLNFPVYTPDTIAYFDGVLGGTTDAVVLKLDSAQVPLWITYMGGTGVDFGNTIDVENNGTIYVAGGANAGFPIKAFGNAYIDSFANQQDGFIARFGSNLQLQWSTFWGGFFADEILKILVNENSTTNRIVVCGYANDHVLFPLASGGYFQSAATGTEAFISTFDAGGELQWSTLYGGHGTDVATSLTVDGANNLYVTGYTNSSNFPNNQVPGAYNQVFLGGGTDGFILKFTPFNYLSYGTYYGGTGNDYFSDVAIGKSNACFYTGYTNSTNFPLKTPAAAAYMQTTNAGGYDAFIVKHQSNVVREWSTYYGGSQNETGTAVACDSSGRVYISGFTFSNNLYVDSPLFQGAYYQPANGGLADGFIAGFTHLGNSFWSTYKGDSCFEYPHDMAIAMKKNKLYIAGEGLYACNQSAPDSGDINLGGVGGPGGAIADGFCWGFGNGSGTTGGIVIPPCMNVSITPVTIPCATACSGVAIASVSGATEPVQWLWSNGVVNDTATGLCNGEVWVQATDAAGCVEQVVIVFPRLAAIASVVTYPTCMVDVYGGEIYGAGYGGNPPYIYEWSTGDSAVTHLQNLSGGYYSLTVTDYAGCTASIGIDLYTLPYEPYRIEAIQWPACGVANGIIVALDTAGDPVEVVWYDSSGVFATADTLFNLNSGVYGIVGAWCNEMGTYPIQIELLDTIELGAAILVESYHTNCLWGNGLLTVELSPNYVYNEPLTFEWSTGYTDQTVYSLEAGYYTVTVTDASGCTAFLETDWEFDYPHYDIPQFDFSQMVVTPANCANASEGSIIDLQAVSETLEGESWYGFEWSVTDPVHIDGYDLLFLPAGDYTVTVTNGLDCTAETTINVPYDTTTLSVLYSGGCSNVADDGLAQVIIDENFSNDPYWFEWPNGSYTTQDFMYGLPENTPLIVQVYAANTVRAVCFTIPESDPIVPTITVNSFSCTYVEATASIPGDDWLSINWSNGISGATAYFTQAGMYYVDILTTSGCSIQDSVYIEVSSMEVYVDEVVPIACNGGLAEISVTADFGVEPYVGTGTFYAPAGTNDFLVTDSTGCATLVTITVAEPAPFELDVYEDGAMCGESQMHVSITGNNLPPYSYLWSSGVTSTTAMYYASQMVYVTVTDAHGCSAIDSNEVFVTQYPDIMYTVGDILCYGGLAEVEITITNDDPNNYAGTGTFYVPAGYNEFVVEGVVWGCGDTVSFVITQPDELFVTADSVSSGCNSVTVAASATGGLSPYSYVWSNGSLTADAVYTGNGIADITVTDVNGCNAVSTVTVVVVPTVQASFTVDPIFCNGETTILDVTATNGTMPYVGTGTFAISAGSYDYIVTDDAGCADTVSFTITEPDALQLIPSNTPVLCNGGTSEVTLSATGGFGIYVFSGDGFYPAGIYAVSVTDDYGCSATQTITITEPDELLVEIDSDIQSVCESVDLIAWISGGVQPYSYLWSDGSTNDMFFEAVTGNISVLVTDSNGCQATDLYLVNVPPPLQATYTANPILCGGDGTTVEITANNGNTPYFGIGTFTISAGSYDYIVTDDLGCADTVSFTLTEPDPLQLTYTGTQILCAEDEANVTLNAIGGTTPYVYTGGGMYSAGTHTVYVTDDNGCADTATFTLTEPPVLTVSIQETTPYVCGVDSMTVQVTAGGGVAPYTGTGTFVFHQSTQINPVITDFNGCIVTGSETIEVPQPPTQIVISDDSICRGDSVVLSSVGNYNFTWYPFGYNTPGFTYLNINQSMNLVLVGTSADGCVSSDSAYLFVANCTVGLAQFEEAGSIRVYPNPASSRLNIEFPYTSKIPYSIRLFAVDGKLVYTDEYAGAEKVYVLNSSNLMEGVYLLETVQGTTASRQRVVITH